MFSVEEQRVKGSSFPVKCVSGNAERKCRKSVVVRDAHDDPLDDVRVSQDTDVHERSAPHVDALEREQGVSTTSADHSKQRDVVAPNLDNDRVVDQRGNPVGDVKLQKTPPGVNDALWGAAESLVGFDRFE